jgi:hypothetical protein
MSSYLDRMVVDGLNRDAWLDARSGRVDGLPKIGGSDASSFAKVESASLYLRAKLHNPFNGNAYTAHGNDRERAILAAFGIQQNRALFHAPPSDDPFYRRHVATPDGIVQGATRLVLAQVKTGNHPLPKTTPRAILRQMWWEQYVLDADESLLIWEQHDGFSLVDMDPISRRIARDDAEIADLITIANIVLGGMDAAERFKKEIQNA